MLEAFETNERDFMTNVSEAASLTCDVAVVGGGLLGCFTARELAGQGLQVTLIEQQPELCAGISKANTAIIYSGAYAKPDTLKAQLCTQACRTFEQLCDELQVRFERRGSLMVCFGPQGLVALERFLTFAEKNGVEGLRIISGDEARAMEPALSSTVYRALFDPHTGTVLPWELGLAAARDAAARGVRIWRGTQVVAIAQADKSAGAGGYELSLTPMENIPHSVRRVLASPDEPVVLQARAVVNCAGLQAAELLETLMEPQVRIIPEKGTYYVLDTKAASCLQHIVFCEPEVKGKGLTLVPTVDGNILVGPTQELATGEEDRATTQNGFAWLDAQVEQVIPDLPLEHIIRSFAATRPNPYWVHRDVNTGEVVVEERSISNFIVGKYEELPGFLSLIGVKTPGLTCAHELGKLAAREVIEYLLMQDAGIDERKSNLAVSPLETPLISSLAPAPDLANERDDEVICRCRSITRGAVVAALRSEPRPLTLDGVKRLTECGMGRCQGSFCTQRVLEVMAEELDIPLCDLLKDLPGSQIILRQETPAPEVLSDVSAAEGQLSTTSLSRPLREETCNIAIIGGGAAGMAAALEFARQGERGIVLIDREQRLGGVCNQCIHDGFGMQVFSQNMTGVQFAARMREQIEEARSAIRVRCCTTVLAIEEASIPAHACALRGLQTAETCARVKLSSVQHGSRALLARRVVLATGCRERPASSLPLAGTRPAGIVAAGALQKMLNCAGYRLGTRAVILGSGDVGLIVARRLKLTGCEVVCVVEMASKCGGRRFNRQRCLDAHGIPLVCDSTVVGVFGQERVNGVTVRNVKTGEEHYVACDLLVSSLGLVPERELIECWEEELPSWLTVCGNAHHVYDLVDTLVLDVQASSSLTCSSMSV